MNKHQHCCGDSLFFIHSCSIGSIFRVAAEVICQQYRFGDYKWAQIKSHNSLFPTTDRISENALAKANSTMCRLYLFRIKRVNCSSSDSNAFKNKTALRTSYLMVVVTCELYVPAYIFLPCPLHYFRLAILANMIAINASRLISCVILSSTLSPSVLHKCGRETQSKYSNKCRIKIV